MTEKLLSKRVIVPGYVLLTYPGYTRLIYEPTKELLLTTDLVGVKPEQAPITDQERDAAIAAQSMQSLMAMMQHARRNGIDLSELGVA